MDQAWYSRPWEIWGFDPDWHSHRPGRTGSIETGCSRAPDHLLHWRKITMPMHADGVMIATQASPGKGTLQIAARRAPRGSYAIIVIRNRKTGQTLRYTISDEWAPKILDWNRSLDPAGRYAAAMNADGLFQVAPLQ